MKKTLLILFAMVMIPIATWGQQEDSEPDHSYKPLQVKLNEDGSKYIRFILWHQMWLQGGSEQKGPKFSIRRSRVLAYAQISPRFLILTHFGLNSLGAGNLTANPNSQSNNQRSLLFLHDAWAEFAVEPGKLHIGSGLHYWNGISRLTNQSTLNMMTLDNPGGQGGVSVSDARLFPWSNITTSDQFARHLGIYAKGSLGKFGYRISANNARNNIGTLGPQPTFQVDNSTGTGTWNYAGYFKYDLFDKESDKLPYFVGTYLGKKKVLSIGAGFHYHPDALAVNDLNNREDVFHAAFDIFYDAPINNTLAISALGAYYNYNYGDTAGAPGGGLVPSSGSILHGQVGLLFRNAKLMPYVKYNTQSLDFTPDNGSEFGVGLNYFINGHFAKITAEFLTGKSGAMGAENRNVFAIQTHIFL
ncbi:porin [Winogradskyella tangerina]|uniref:porin n=1 Tax=Winogradskyella tangerina TaxID=2023240 RepID=UPI0013006347|nr:porin [Winogradskyella tangerina]